MVFLLIAVGVVFVVLMLVGLWLSSSALADTLLAPVCRYQAKDDHDREHEFEALVSSDARGTKKRRKPPH